MHELARFTIFGNLIGTHGRPQRCRIGTALFPRLYRGRAVVPRLGERLYVSSRTTLDFLLLYVLDLNMEDLSDLYTPSPNQFLINRCIIFRSL